MYRLNINLLREPYMIYKSINNIRRDNYENRQRTKNKDKRAYRKT